MEKLKKIKIKKRRCGFTLVELLLVIAIIGILSGIILVGVTSYRKNARVTKVMAELGGQLQNITMCFSDDGSVGAPNGGSNICQGRSSYGKWPALLGDWGYGSSEFRSSSNWYFSASSSEDRAIICCNSTYSKCGKVDGGCGLETEINDL
ncbi:MAG TPA: prepilin-type N-terminal cleavage/methylation domain-containing protein [Candidatus Moranbacteria bacterium]|nr:prepilin-type N-terminal cleavage/methylation domain-containing protein [Candidatus Moranbacteria bacterium]